jgi:serine/threonine protein phosphatase PrpC
VSICPGACYSSPPRRFRDLRAVGCSHCARFSTLALFPRPNRASFPYHTALVPHIPSLIGLSDVGRTRTRNEDSLSLVPDLGVAVVADGMGGHPGGDVASRIAAETAAAALADELGTGADGQDMLLWLREAMRRSILRAHEEIRSEGEREPGLEGMGTTITALAVDPEADVYVLGHVGDSRAYRFRGGALTQLTRDDTWVQERVDANILTLEQARRHPFAHLLTQCLGLEDTPTPHITDGSVQVGDVFLLCTDGLVGMVEDADLETILARELDGNGAKSSGEASTTSRPS